MAKKTKKAKIATRMGIQHAPGQRWRLLSLRVAAIVVLALVTVLTYVSLTYASFAPVAVGNTTINNAANQQVLEPQLAQAAADYRLTLQYSDGNKQSFAPAEIGITIDTQSSAENIRHYLDNHIWQRLAWWQPIHLRLVTKTDTKKLDYFLGNKTLLTTTAPVNASLTATGGQAAITPEASGRGYAVRNAEKAVPRSIATLSNQPLVLVSQPLPPDITASNLEPAKAKLAHLLGQRISFAVGQNTIVALPANIADWVELTPAIKDKTVDITINSGKIEKYIEGITDKYTEPPRSRVVMQASTGEIVLDAGSSGIDITKKDETAATVAQAAQKGQGYAAELPITYSSAKTVRVPFVEKVLVVDTTTKRMYAYQNAALVKTILVSAGAPKTPTVMGQYAIYAKYAKQDMRGGNADGSRYFQADVPYVNYFYKDYAIHGNYWRSNSYFGNINSSHGCVGITPGDGAWIYDWAPIGTPVIVHD